jgi:hypothetical protein
MWHFTSSLSTPTHGYILQASMFISPEESFFLPVYAEAMARASPPTRPSCVPRGRNIDPRVIEYLDIDATVDASFPVDCSDSESKSLSGEIFQRRSSKSRPCSDDSISQSSYLFGSVLLARLVSFLHSFRFAVRFLGPLPLIFMMVFLSFGLNDHFWWKSFAS